MGSIGCGVGRGGNGRICGRRRRGRSGCLMTAAVRTDSLLGAGSDRKDADQRQQAEAATENGHLGH